MKSVNLAVGSYHRVSAHSSDSMAVDPGAIHLHQTQLLPTEEHHGRARMRILAFTILVLLLLGAFFAEFGSTIASVRGSASSNVDDVPADTPQNDVPLVEDGIDNDMKPGEDETESRGADPEEEDTNIADPDVDPTFLARSWSAKAMQTRCPSWSAQFASRFEQECGYWIQIFASWEQSLARKDPSKSVVYACLNEKLCRDWGDSISGMESAFLRALRSQLKFKMKHPSVNQIFQPCLFENRRAQWAAQSYVPSVSEGCFDNTVDCIRWNHMNCERPNLVAVNTDRTCFHPTQCGRLAKVMPDFSLVNLAGCAMRAMFEPKRQFLERNKFDFKLLGKSYKLTLKGIKEYLASYYVIGIYVKLGPSLSSEAILDQQATSHDLFRPIRCAQTVESFVSDASLQVNGKKVIWLVVTDSHQYKATAFARFKDKTAGFEFEPKRIDQRDAHEFGDSAKEIGEWYILGLADQLIVTKWNIGSDTYDENGGPKSRLNGFSRSAWLYNLKDQVYFAGTCELEVVDVKGMTDLSKSCKNSTRLRWKPPQPHLEILKQNNKSFPEYYVASGKILARE